MIIDSLLDQDFYKFTMQNAVFQHYPDVSANYNFILRKLPELPFNEKFFNNEFNNEIASICNLKFQTDELDFLESQKCFSPQYLQYLKSFRFKINQIAFSKNPIAENVNIPKIEIEGTWLDTILWEVPLMAIISELYFKYCDTTGDETHLVQTNKIKEKIKFLNQSKVNLIEMGTRRRRSFEAQANVLINLSDYTNNYPHYVGTSNVYFAKFLKQKPIGSMAHEWIMAIGAMESLLHANKIALTKWNETYDGKFSIALADTYGTNAFLNDFGGSLARSYDGVRHDSGDPFEFTEKIIAHYKLHNIDSKTKKIIYSDGLSIPKSNYELSTMDKLIGKFGQEIKQYFGVGTDLTNDFGSPALNMVIKMTKCNGLPTIKISNVPTKATGESLTVAYAKHLFSLNA